MVLRTLASFVVPPVCFACGKAMTAGKARLCTACLALIRRVGDSDEPFRSSLGRLQSEGGISGFVVPWYVDRKGPLQVLIHRLKYGGMTRIGEELGEEVGRCAMASGIGKADGIVPVPLHPSKLRERGYNQSEHIGRGMARVTGWPLIPRLVERRRFTPSQTLLSADERHENVRGAFIARPSRRRPVDGRTFILVDDIVTTGATMCACASALCGAGARNVFCCAIGLAS